MSTDIYPVDEMGFGEVVIYSVGNTKLTPAILKQNWHRNGLKYAVDKLLQQNCFLSGLPGHDDCRKLWDSLPATDWSTYMASGDEKALIGTQYYEFYCLGQKNHCVNCGEEWLGLAVMRFDIPKYGLLVGDVTAKHCPGCGEPYDMHILQRHFWFEKLAGTLGGEIQNFSRIVQQTRVDMIFRLGAFLVKAALIGGSSDIFVAEELKRAVLAKLTEYELEGTEVYNVADWVAKSPHVLPEWGLDPDVVEATWTRNQMRNYTPLVNETWQAMLKSSVSGLSLPDLKSAFTLGTDQERIKDLKTKLSTWGRPAEVPVQSLVLCIDGKEYLVMELNGTSAAKARLEGLRRVEAPVTAATGKEAIREYFEKLFATS